ncbi:MAG TPA: hypothetical protein V6D02_11515, partial [Candidatus Obscuribacterales bacterium]
EKMANSTQYNIAARGSGGGGGGRPGGGETATNNLSFPVIWAEGQAMAIPGTPGAFSFTTPYDVNRDGQITTADQINGGRVVDMWMIILNALSIKRFQKLSPQV